MVKPLGKIPDSEVTARDLSFKSVWKELRGQGWTRKPPPRRSLDDRFFYLRPGRSLNGEEGTDYFRGESAVLELYANILRSTAPAATVAPGDAQLAAAAEIVRQNYAADIEAAESWATNTPVAVKHRGEPTPEPPATPPRSEASAKRPARRSLIQTPSPPSTPPRRASGSPEALIATSPHVQGSPASEDDTDPYVPSPSASDTVEVASVESIEESDAGAEVEQAAVASLGNDLLGDNDDDLNTIELGGDAAHFGSIDSGDEAEKDDVEEGEYESEVDVEENCTPEDVHDDPEETETEIAAEVLFAENFIESFGGVYQVLAGNLETPVLRSMTSNGCEDVEEPDITAPISNPYEPLQNNGAYPGLRQGYSGPTAEALRHGDSPVALFFFFMPVVLWQHIAACSNEYHREMLPLRVDEAYLRYGRKHRRTADLPRKTRRDIQHDLEAMKPIMPHELC